MGKQTVAISGVSGLVGSALSQALSVEGHVVRPMVRRQPAPTGSIYWNAERAEVDEGALEGVDAVVHLAGENIGAKRWSDRQKDKIRRSRVDGTRLIADALSRLERKPASLLVASAVGYYGDTDEADESSPAGEGFLAEVCEQWEAAAAPASEAGIRVAQLRFGIVLAKDGGALEKMLPLFKLGLGGRLGPGDQGISWITLDDAVAAILFVLRHPELSGPVNLTAPQPGTNEELTRSLAAAFDKSAPLPVPAFMLRLALGEMADQMLLQGAKAIPRRLLDSGFEFSHPELGPAIEHVLGVTHS